VIRPKIFLFLVFLTIPLFSQDYDGRIPVTFYDPYTSKDVGQWVAQIEKACIILGTPGQDSMVYENILSGFSDVLRDKVPADIKRAVLVCGQSLANSKNAQALDRSVAKPIGIVRSVFDSLIQQPDWQWIAPSPSRPSRLVPAPSPASKRVKPNAPIDSRKASVSLREHMEGSISAAALAGSGYSVIANKKDRCPVDKDGITRCNLENDLVEGVIARPDGEYIAPVLFNSDTCRKDIEKRVRAGDPSGEQELADQYFRCVDPCLTQEERLALLDPNCDKSCLAARVRKERATFDSNTQTRKCLAYVKPEPQVEEVEQEGPLPAKPVQVTTEKGKKMQEIVEATGGAISKVRKPQDTANAIKERLTLRSPKTHYQVMFLIDASGSMKDNVEDLKSQIGGLMEHTKQQLEPGGQVSFGVRYYVAYGDYSAPYTDFRDYPHAAQSLEVRISERPVPLDSREALVKRAQAAETDLGALFIKPDRDPEAREAKRGLAQTIEFIQSHNGYTEYHWDESLKAMKGEPWAATPDVERVLFLLTDEAGDISETRYNKNDVIHEAKKRGIRFEVIMFDEDEGLYQSAPGPFNQEMLKRLVDATGGLEQLVDDGNQLVSVVQERLKGGADSGAIGPKKPAHGLQSMFIIDASMGRERVAKLGFLKDRLADVMTSARALLDGHGRAEFGVRYFGRYKPVEVSAVPLGATDQETLRDGLNKAMEANVSEGPMEENELDYIKRAITLEPWSHSRDVEKVIFLISSGSATFTQSQQDKTAGVIQLAKRKGIRVEVILINDPTVTTLRGTLGN